MRRSAWLSRVAPAFGGSVEVACKTGTLVTMRHEGAVVTFPAGEQYAVAVLTEAHSPGAGAEQDLALGRIAVDLVRTLRQAHR